MRGKRHSKKHVQEEEQVDKISDLPDNLIHEILSFIDMSCAVQTSILSKRWKNVWRSLPFISLDFGSIWEEQKYANFVDKLFEFRDNSYDIQRFSLKCLILDDDSSVEALNRWILAVVRLKVQDLDIRGVHCLDSAYEIPFQLLNCKSVKTLRFMMFGFDGRYKDIILPESMMSLPQTKTLVLTGLSISDLQIQRLIASCPLLDMACIQLCNIQTSNHRNIIIDSKNLMRFALVNNYHTCLVSADDDTLTTKICAPNLDFFSCTGFMTEDFSLENLSSLSCAVLDMRYQDVETQEIAEIYLELPAEVKQEVAKRMLKLLAAVREVRTLKLSSGFLEVLLQGPGTLYLRPTQLRYLGTLELEMWTTTGCLRSIAHLLKISPILRVLTITSKESNLADVGDHWEAELSSACMSSHLESVKIREVEGCDNELRFLRCLLENCMALKELTIIFKSTSDSTDRGRQIRRFKRHLIVPPIASSSIEVNFYNHCQ